MRLNFEEYGSGRPLIILHGLFGSLNNWRSISRELGKRFKVFALDQRNHGRSPHSSEFDYRLMAEDFQEFMTEHGLESAVVLGHSMGGKTAMQFALMYPPKVQTLIVVDILPGKYCHADHSVIDPLRKLIELKPLSTLKEADFELSFYIQDVPVRRLLLKNLTRTELGYLDWHINLKGIVENLNKMSDGVSGTPFRKPCLFIRGGLSEHLPDDGWAQARKFFPSARLITIDEAGHWVHADQPEPFLVAVSNFILESQG